MNLLRKQSFACASCDVLPGAGVTSHADHRNRPQRVICLAISATIEPVAMDLARGCLQRTGTAKRRQCRLAVQLGGIVVISYEQGGGRLRTDTEASKKTPGRLSWSIEPVGRNRKLVIAFGGDLETPFAFGTNSVQMHEFLHPLLAHRDTTRHQFVLSARPAAGAAGFGVQRLNMHQQRLVAQVLPLRIAGTAHQVRVYPATLTGNTRHRTETG